MLIKLFRKKIILVIAFVLVLALPACRSVSDTDGLADTAADTAADTGKKSSKKEDLILYPADDPDHLTLTTFKAGASDAFVLTGLGHTVVIDTSTDKKSDAMVEYLSEMGITKIDELIISHFDKDHVGGADKLINNFEVGTIYTTYRSKDSDQIVEYDEALKNRGLTETVVTSTTTYEAAGVTYTIYPPASDSYDYKESNNSSLAVKVVYGENVMLFAGDAEEQRLSELMTIPDLICTILKVPHHGRFNNNTAAFIDYVKPKYAIITSSKGDPEDDATVAALEKAGSAVYYTRDGDLCFYMTKDSLEVSR